MPTTEILDKARELRRSYRLIMNGEAARAMLDHGLTYKLNWGASLPDLRRLSENYDKSLPLAIELWKDDIRESRIMATLLTPPADISAELADLWMETATTTELVEMLVHNLLQHTAFAPNLAFAWLATDNRMKQYGGYLLLGKLLARGQQPNSRGRDELTDQAATTIAGGDALLAHAAQACIQRLTTEG